MDPLSIIGTAIALAQAADASYHAVQRLLALRNAPANLEAVMNELTDFRALLNIVQSSLQMVVANEHAQALIHLNIILNRGFLVVAKLDSLIETRLVRLDRASDLLQVRKRGFLKEGRLNAIRAELRDVRQSVMAALTALQTAQLAPLPKLLLAVQSISAVVQNDDLALPRQVPLLDNDGMDPAKSMEQAVSTDMPPDYTTSIGFPQDNSNTSIVIRTTAVEGRCLSYCPCQCHQRSTGQTPMWLKSLFGVMFYESAGFPILNRRPCNWRECHHVSSSGAKFEYRFPSWMLNVIVSASVTNNLDGISAKWSIRMPDITDNESIPVAMVLADDPADIQRMMYQYKVSPKAVSGRWGYSMLEFALSHRRLETVRMLTNNGADWHYRGGTGMSPFHFGWSSILLNSERTEYHAELEALLQRVDTLEAMQFNPLHKVISGLSDGNLQNLLELDSSLVSKPDAAGQTPLAWAVMKHDRAAVRLLLEYGADAELKKYSTNAIFALAYDVEIMDMLLQAGADINGCDGEGVTSLRHCVACGLSGQVQWLLDHGANPDLPRAYPPICEAAAHGYYDVLKVLLDYGVSLDSKTYTGFTPMMMAVTRNRIHLFDLLLSRGARLDTVTPDGVDIFWIVAQNSDVYTMNELTKMKLRGFDMSHTKVNKYWNLFHGARYYSTRTAGATKQEEMEAYGALLESAMEPKVAELSDEENEKLETQEVYTEKEEYSEKSKELWEDDDSDAEDEVDVFADALESIRIED